ncbi:MAG: TRAP transporter large permease [Deltaproteobacteria bacterium]|nr:TRAP transporter large permease [Deltaproteobacteria bacterium]
MMFKLLGILLGALAIVGMPLFAVLGGMSILCWLGSDDPSKQFVRFVAANVLDDRFAGSVINVTIPLFTFAGYLMAESKAPDRIVRAASALLGWLPGGLAVACILASAVFTTLTGGSGVTIVAIGGLLLPALIKQGYPRGFSLGLVTAAGAVGLLLPPSPLVLVYGFVSGIDIGRAYLATIVPAVLLMVLLGIFCVVMAMRQKVPRQDFEWRVLGSTLYEAKWELLAPVLVLVGLGTGLMALHESAAAAALYVMLVEVYVYRDLTWRKVVKVARDALCLAGAIILILAMATALTNYVIDAGVPQRILAWFVDMGMSERWHFVLVLNIFMFILGMLLDAFSAMLVALPLLIPMAAHFGVPPFWLAVMFLLNLGVAYVTPPVGLNLFIAAFRFRRPVLEIYRVVLPFVGVLAVGLLIIMLWPRLSTFTVEGAVTRLKEQAAKTGQPPRDAWQLECVQEDRNNPLPCKPDDITKWGEDGLKWSGAGSGDAGAPDAEREETVEDLEAAFDEASGSGGVDAGAGGPAADAGGAPAKGR